jgi:hypothetical protein
MKVTKLRKMEVKELSAEEREQELKDMENVKGCTIGIKFEPNSFEQKMAEKRTLPIVVKSMEVIVIEE